MAEVYYKADTWLLVITAVMLIIGGLCWVIWANVDSGQGHE